MYPAKHPKPAPRSAAPARPAGARVPGRPDRVDDDERLDELHHRRIHARRLLEDDEDRRGR